MKIKNYLRRLVKGKPLLKVYSHPRSGTHFLEAFISENFYKNKDLSTKKVEWGHWSNRKIKKTGNPYGQLFGSHTHVPDKFNYYGPKIYIIRDGRAVAYSIWKTPNFLNSKLQKLSFHDFLKEKIDWIGTPANRSNQIYSILEHWYLHVKAWEDFAEKNENLLIIKYEDLINNPYQIYLKIHKYFFNDLPIIKKDDLNIIKKPVGLLPNKATVNSWEQVFLQNDIDLYYEVLSKGLNSYQLSEN